MSNQVIKVRTNESIIGKLKNAFTSPGCVLTEAMQNARRAGASKVEFSYLHEDALMIVDDGTGISDLADFLTLAGSGWSEEVVQQEGAFGMGSFSMLYYCDWLRVESNGQCFQGYTQDILNGMEIPVISSSVTSGTKIELYGYEISDENNASRIEQTLIQLAKGFSIPVFYDGEELERPYSLDKCEQAFITTDIGKIAVSDLDSDLETLKNRFSFGYGTTSSRLFFQGLPVGESSGNHIRFHSNIVHLDESQFSVRMPDRDVLIDHDSQSQKVKDAVRKLWLDKLTELKGKLAPAVFVDNFAQTLKDWGASEMLNDMDVVPGDVLYQVTGLPERGDTMTCDEFTTSLDATTRQELEASNQKILFIEDDYGDEAYQVHQYAYHTGAFCVDDPTLRVLHSGHWLRNMLMPITEEDIDVLAEKPNREGQFSGHIGFGYQCCESYKVSGPLGDAEVTDECYAVNQDLMLIPMHALDGEDVKLIGDYRDENDSLDDLALDQDVDRFQALLYLLNQSREEGILSLLRTVGLTGFDLQGQRLLVEFDDSGLPEKVSLPESDAA